jgi:hypothetical protein
MKIFRRIQHHFAEAPKVKSYQRTASPYLCILNHFYTPPPTLGHDFLRGHYLQFEKPWYKLLRNLPNDINPEDGSVYLSAGKS